MTPTPEDYQISPEEAIAINAKATQRMWVHITSPTSRENIYYLEKDLPLHLAGICGNATDSSQDAANAAAIAHNHNNTPGLCRRLIELEDAVLRLANSDENLTDAINDIVYLAERIKAERAAQPRTAFEKYHE